MPAFYDGDGIWKVRFNPGEAGHWQAQLSSRPANPDFAKAFDFEVADADAPRLPARHARRRLGLPLRERRARCSSPATPPTTSSACTIAAATWRASSRRRKQQGFNLFRTRLHTSYFHPPFGTFEWQTKRMWPWGGSSTSPRFDLFNLDWFRSVDASVALVEGIGGLGLEMIMEGWGFEFPFNHRTWFTAEWEALWMRYLIARYDAYNCVWFWTPLNEYEYYPNGDWHWTPTADRWALRIGRWIKETAPHGHVLSMHNGPRLPPFAQRFRADPEAVDAIMFQEWGTRDRDDGWLAAGIEEGIAAAFDGWQGSAVFAEWGYERNPGYELKLPIHEFCDRNHTRRSAWRGVFSGLGIIAGFENSWGPWMDLENDLPGVADLVVLNRFMRGLRFEDLQTGRRSRGRQLRARPPSAGVEGPSGVALAYFPAGGEAELPLQGPAAWLDPRTGERRPATGQGGRFTAPAETDADGHPQDFVLVAGDAMTERITARYLLETAVDPRRAAEAIAGEQSSGTFLAIPGETAELKDRAGARIERLEVVGEAAAPSLPGAAASPDGRYLRSELTLSWPLENIGPSLPNLMATVAGNLFELKQVSGLRLLDIALPEPFFDRYPGPRFGIDGTRALSGVHGRPLIGTIVKPSVGLDAEATASSSPASARPASTSSRTTSSRPMARPARSTRAPAP